MTNLDVICKVLNQVTQKPENNFRQAIVDGIKSGSIPVGKLYDKCPDGEERVKYFVQHEAQGILNWAVQGAIMTHAASLYCG